MPNEKLRRTAEPDVPSAKPSPALRRALFRVNCLASRPPAVKPWPLFFHAALRVITCAPVSPRSKPWPEPLTAGRDQRLTPLPHDQVESTVTGSV
ncbi:MULTISPECIES: hypothetical protein [Saccharothrix]|uniref:hypothetical protein n=1 Tax=Saccharothrix TaxID=2071 RepID=UPI00093F2E36|nr:hypothetical protein [Saccharothrix sp. CB00851]OKI16232.1 hypothetical protein A6A25_13215 [Saccharothrix sp. CB00851]